MLLVFIYNNPIALDDKKNKKILDYLLERGLGLEAIRSFRLGYAMDDAGLKQHLEKNGYKLEDMLEAGLFRESERKKGDIYPFFRARVMFPVQDLQGRVVAFGGRVMPESHGGPPDKSAPKYIRAVVTTPMMESRIWDLRKTRFAPITSPSAVLSATMREIAVGSPAELITSNVE